MSERAPAKADLQAISVTALHDVVKMQEAELRARVDAELALAVERNSRWHVEQAFWIARHMRTRTAYIGACWSAAEVLTQIEQEGAAQDGNARAGS